MTDSGTTVAALYRYPVKGLRGVEMHSADLVEGHGVPGDRRFAIVRSGGEGQPLDGAWATSRTFAINAICEGLLSMDLTVSNDETEVIIVTPDGQSATISPGQTDAPGRVNEILAAYFSRNADSNVSAPAIVERDGGKGYWDYRDTPVSIINHATVEAVARSAGRKLDPLRFRGNLYVTGLPAWEENSWLGQRLRIGEAELAVIRGCERCPAISIDPQSGERDMQLPTLMQQNFGHIFCGVYAQVTKGGRVRANDRVEVLGPANRDPLEALPDNAPPYARWPRFAEVSRRIDGAGISIHLTPDGPWPLPAASIGQKIRVHLGDPGWVSARVAGFEDGEYRLTVRPGEEPGSAMAALIDIAREGTRLLVSGPYGRAAPAMQQADEAAEKSVRGIF